MTIEEIQAVLGAALKLRPPRKQDHPEEGRAQLVGRIEDYMLESAYHHAELEEAFHYLDHSIEQLREQIEQLEGYEVGLPRKPQDRITQADINRAKRVIAPELFEAGGSAKKLRESVKRQIERIEWAHTVLSRAYTLISGS